MKRALLVLLALFVLPFFGNGQTIENIDFVSPFHNGLAAIKKDGQWAFINTKGAIVIDYRTDLVVTTTDHVNYPIFNDDRCIIEQDKNGISYFGYIDTSGATVIEPQFLNAANFSNGKALALELIKNTVAKNEALGKNVVYYKYYEVVIDLEGKVENYLNPKGVNVVIDKEFLREPPIITAKRLSDHLYAFKNKNNKWTLIKLN
ncbi:WG repeat-containing protein [Winogradskyella helgolandensis]|uniref:WG repeat-containing protein n=1 Tax=Winogradskyella helgolandensis TaxID=2697010 RepID=UPI0015BD0281|nr:WG repeat-containing protein [Winogradskyella helgolandensis]